MMNDIASCRKAGSDGCPSRDKPAFRHFSQSSRYESASAAVPLDELTTAELLELDETCELCDAFEEDELEF